MRLFPCLVLFCSAVFGAEPPRFFAMDTAARLEPAECAQVLSELGYDGLGGRPVTARQFAPALSAKKLAFVNGYHVTSFAFDDAALPADLVKAVDALEGLGTTLWLGIQKVRLPVGQKAGPESGDEVAVPALRRLLAYAKPKGVKVSLYPHAGFWAERFETCLRIADKVDDPDLGVTFNLCHWLKVEGAERDPEPLLRAAKPRLNFVTVCGADTGDTRKLGWDKLIQPLGRGTYDVGAFLAKARAAGFTGPVGFQGFGIKMDSRELLAETMAAWKKLGASK